MDSSGIALIIGRAELCSERGARLIVRSLSASLYRIVKISGIEKHKSVTLL
jgi:anti-anti-sigma factor